MRSAVLAVLAVITMIAVSGCVVFDGNPDAGQEALGPVTLTFTVCSDQSPAPPGACTGSSMGDNGSYPSQIWLGFQVPRGTGLPTKFSSSAIDAAGGPAYTGPQIHFTASNWYSAALESAQPAAAGYEWAGYVSNWQNYSVTSGPQNFTATVDFGLPPAKNGKPFAGPFDYKTIVGGAQYEQGTNPEAPTAAPNFIPNCSNTSQDGPDDSTYYYLCFDAIYPSSGLEQQGIANAVIVPGKALSASRGSTATERFTFSYAGPSLGEPFTFSATSTLHGAKLKITPASFSPSAAASSKVTVTVKVPAHARSGTYKVTLTAKLASGPSRTAAAKLKVH